MKTDPRRLCIEQVACNCLLTFLFSVFFFRLDFWMSRENFILNVDETTGVKSVRAQFVSKTRVCVLVF